MSSTFETLPRELRDQIYNDVFLPIDKTILPFRHPFDNTATQIISCPAILLVNRSIYAEAVVRLYATNTLQLRRPHLGVDKARQTAMSFWNRLGPSVQHVRVDLTAKAITVQYLADEYTQPPLCQDVAARLWAWERAALREAAANNLQTLTLDLKACSKHLSSKYSYESRTAAVTGMVNGLLKDLDVGRVTVYWGFRRWFKGEGQETMKRRDGGGEGGDRGMVKHLVIRGHCDCTEARVVMRLCRDLWSVDRTGLCYRYPL